jgi:hypothetical protein
VHGLDVSLPSVAMVHPSQGAVLSLMPKPLVVSSPHIACVAVTAVFIDQDPWLGPVICCLVRCTHTHTHTHTNQREIVT